eukprot:TRINITY_DN2256_c0_g1_i1.p1 TRINITY_DN2256_c0_g1~~TRINITY_DN2256_c0_g1_i1.p1  ORF type:complete len:905 (+),score=237.11 TRINITY_DN2256_c0_g1_i1:127-2841(+)
MKKAEPSTPSTPSPAVSLVPMARSASAEKTIATSSTSSSQMRSRSYGDLDNARMEDGAVEETAAPVEPTSVATSTNTKPTETPSVAPTSTPSDAPTSTETPVVTVDTATNTITEEVIPTKEPETVTTNSEVAKEDEQLSPLPSASPQIETPVAAPSEATSTNEETPIVVLSEENTTVEVATPNKAAETPAEAQSFEYHNEPISETGSTGSASPLPVVSEVRVSAPKEIDTNDVVPPPSAIEPSSIAISGIVPIKPRSKSITEESLSPAKDKKKRRNKVKTSDSESGSQISLDSEKRNSLKKVSRSREGSLPLPTSSSSLKKESPRIGKAREDAALLEVSRERIAAFESLIQGITNSSGELNPSEAALLSRIVEEMEARADAERELKAAREQIAALKKENASLQEALKGEAAGLLDWAPKEVSDLNLKAQEIVKFIADMSEHQKRAQQKAAELQTYLGGIFTNKLVKASDRNLVESYDTESESGSRISKMSTSFSDLGSPIITERRSTTPFISNVTGLPNLSTPQLCVPGTYASPDAVISQINADSMNRNTEELSQKGKILRELIETERSYVKDLALTIKYYLEPLKTSPYLKPSDHNIIFSNIQLLFSIHQTILQKLETLNASENVGVVFVQMAEFFKMYTQYCTNHPFSCELLKKAVKNSAFNNYLEELRTKNEELCRLDLPSYLIKPIQRLCKYPLLMEQLKRTTDKNDDEYADLHTAVSKINEIVALVNTEKNIAENQTKLVQLNENIAFNKDISTIVTQGRIIVKEGAVKLVSEKGKRSNCNLVLFNDAVIVLKKATGMGGKKWKCETYFQLDNAYFAADAGDDDYKHGFKMNLINKKQTYIWITKSTAERDSWISEINSCISKLLAKSEPEDEEITFIGEGKTKQPSKSLFSTFSQKTL